MACSRCGKKSSEKFTPASSVPEGTPRPRPALRQRSVKHSARAGRFGQPLQPAQQPSPPSGD